MPGKAPNLCKMLAKKTSFMKKCNIKNTKNAAREQPHKNTSISAALMYL